MSKTVLITGATGSIGTKLREHFAARDFRLRLLCLNPQGDPDVVTADLSRYDETWARHFEGADAVIHLAGNPYATASWASVQSINIDLTLNVFRAAQNHRAGRIVFASSNWVMAGYRFTAERLTTELAPRPINPYGCGKLFCERAGRQLAQQTGISFIALRIGCCQHIPGNNPGPQIEHGLWGRPLLTSSRTPAGNEASGDVMPFNIVLALADPQLRLAESRQAVVFVADGEARTVVRRETFDDLVRMDL